MKKAIVIITLLTLLLSIPVLAENILKTSYVETTGEVSEPGAPAFAFVSGRLGGAVTSTHIFDSPYMPSRVGGNCQVGEYIRVYQCDNSQGDGCQITFADDWLKEHEQDLIPYSNWASQTWLRNIIDGLGKKYTMYQCLEGPGAPTSVQAPQGSGRFTSISYPREVKIGEQFHVKGSFLCTGTGPFILETGVDPTSIRTLAVLTSERSPCDGSAYYSGLQVNGVAGRTYTFDFAVRAPLNPGKYTLSVHSWTACWKDGGQEIQTYKQEIIITEPECDTIGLIKSAIKVYGSYWFLTSAGKAYIEDYSLGCDWQKFSDACGTTDTDKDGIPDKCDTCPRDFGSADSIAIGCHPCFGQSLNDAGIACYLKYEDKYGIPPVIEAQMDPVVTSITQCKDNSNIGIYAVHKSGTKDLKSTEPCPSGTTCENINTATARCIAPEETPPTPTTKRYACNGDSISVYQQYSDGTEELIDPSMEYCDDGCSNGECTEDGDERGGVTTPGTNVVETTDSDCDTDSDCPTNKYCDSLGQCIADTLDVCTSDSDCETGEICAPSVGACLPAESPECVADTDCNEEETCYDGYCGPTFLVETILESAEPAFCDQDQYILCEDGTEVLTGKCVDNELLPTGTHCAEGGSVTEGGIGGFLKSIGIGGADVEAATPISGERETTFNPWLVGGAVLVVLAGIIIYQRTSKKKGKRKKKK